MILGILCLLVPVSICFFCLWRIEKRDAEHYRNLAIKTMAELTYLKYNLGDPKWDDNYKKEKNEKKQQ